MKKILVPTDFSQPSTWAVEAATLIAKRMEAEIVLLHVIEQPGSESFNVEGQVDASTGWEDRLFTMKMIEKGKKDLATIAGIAEGVNVRTKLRLGNPFHGIRTVINEIDPYLVVMGTSGHSKMEEILVGSNTKKVVRYSTSPVLSIHERPVGKDISTIVYATSLNESEEEFAACVVGMQELFAAKVHLVRINTPNNFQPDHVVKQVMQNFADRVRLKNYTLNVFSDYSEEDGIIHFASSINADLIAMATHGRTGVSHVLLGSLAEDIVGQSSKPVLTLVTKDED
jgi:nucleotide-binding universal stress UspA family protein